MINAVSEELITEAVEIYPLLGVGLEAEMFLLKKHNTWSNSTRMRSDGPVFIGLFRSTSRALNKTYEPKLAPGGHKNLKYALN